MSEEKKERRSLTHYLGIGVAVATVLSVVGSYFLFFVFIFSVRSKPWRIVEKGVETAKVAVINLRGIISDPGAYSSGSHIEIVKNALKDIESDKNVKAVVLRINSPGGEGTYTDRIYEEIRRFKKKNSSLKIFSFIETMAASGGYYLACAGDYIMAEPESIVGSIGVFYGKLNIEKLLDKIGARFEIVKSSNKKDFSAFWRSMSEEERKMIDKIISSFYQQFLSVVYEARKNKLTMEKLKQIADGSIYTGRDSYTYGLVDDIGYFQDLIEKVKESIHSKDAKVSEYLPEKSLMDKLFGAKIKMQSIEHQLFSYSSNVWLLWEGYILR